MRWCNAKFHWRDQTHHNQTILLKSYIKGERNRLFKVPRYKVYSTAKIRKKKRLCRAHNTWPVFYTRGTYQSFPAFLASNKLVFISYLPFQLLARRKWNKLQILEPGDFQPHSQGFSFWNYFKRKPLVGDFFCSHFPFPFSRTSFLSVTNWIWAARGDTRKDERENEITIADRRRAG